MADLVDIMRLERNSHARGLYGRNPLDQLNKIYDDIDALQRRR